jgi:hypothetical protein
MSRKNSLGILRAKLNPLGEQRLVEFLDSVDIESAARFRDWLSNAPDEEVRAAAEKLGRTSHGQEFALWWRTRDGGPQASGAPVQALLQGSDAPTRMRSRSDKDLVVGGAWLAGGLLLTMITYSLAASGPGGGRYFIAYGAILYGVIRIFRGLKAA